MNWAGLDWTGLNEQERNHRHFFLIFLECERENVSGCELCRVWLVWLVWLVCSVGWSVGLVLVRFESFD